MILSYITLVLLATDLVLPYTCTASNESCLPLSCVASSRSCLTLYLQYKQLILFDLMHVLQETDLILP